MKKVNVIVGIIAMIAFAIGFSSCEKESTLQNPENTPEYAVLSTNDFSVEVYKLEEGDSLNSRALTYGTSQWNGYTMLNSTGNHSEWFSSGTYAVKITRNLLSPSTLSISTIAQNQGSNYSATAYAYKYDANGSQIYSSGSQVFDMGQPAYFDLSITGNQSIVFILTVTSADYYLFWYRKVWW